MRGLEGWDFKYFCGYKLFVDVCMPGRMRFWHEIFRGLLILVKIHSDIITSILTNIRSSDLRGVHVLGVHTEQCCCADICPLSLGCGQAPERLEQGGPVQISLRDPKKRQRLFSGIKWYG